MKLYDIIALTCLTHTLKDVDSNPIQPLSLQFPAEFGNSLETYVFENVDSKRLLGSRMSETLRKLTSVYDLKMIKESTKTHRFVLKSTFLIINLWELITMTSH